MAKTNDIFGRKNVKHVVDSETVEPVAQAQADASEPTMAEVMAELADLKRQLANKEASKGKGLRVSPKGCVSVYGFGRFPISYYKSTWKALFAMKDEILSFIEANNDALPEKGEKKPVAKS